MRASPETCARQAHGAPKWCTIADLVRPAFLAAVNLPSTKAAPSANAFAEQARMHETSYFSRQQHPRGV
jgi:hypothetical protein